jgi:signal transduction histidine kinase
VDAHWRQRQDREMSRTDAEPDFSKPSLRCRLHAVFLATVALVWLVAALPAHGASRNVLILASRDSQQPAYEEFIRGFRPALHPAEAPIELFTEFLDSARFPQLDHRERMRRLLQDKYRATRLDLVITTSPAALAFALEHHAALFPGVPLIFALVSEQELPPGPLPDDVVGVLDRFDPARTIEMARRLQPDARRVVVVSGSDAFDTMWEGIVRNKMRPQFEGLEVTFLSGLPLPQLLGELSRLSPDTIVLYLSMSRDGAGDILRSPDVAQRVAAAATAPTYGFFASHFGRGVVGGYMNSWAAVGGQTAAVAARLLAGAKAQQVRSDLSPGGAYLVDWRELHRWDLRESRLPPGSDVRFREQTLWSEYRWRIVAVAAALLLQTILIMMLFVQRRQRRRAELEVHRQRAELAHASRLSTLGELSASIAHEVNQPLAAIAGNADAAELLLDADPPKLDDARRVLFDLKTANTRASEVVRRVRDLVRKREMVDEPYDLNGAVSDVVRLLEAESQRRRVEVAVELGALPSRLHGDRLHVQQVLLNLLMNGMEAMADVPDGRRHLSVRTRRISEGHAEIAVSDAGHGIAASDLPRLFDSFFSTKKDGMGLGLSLCRSIVQAHGGRIWAENDPSGGATIRFTLPLPPDRP